MNPLDWFSSNSGGAKPAELVNIASPRAMKTLWRADIGGAGPFVFSPALAEGALYVASRDGAVAKLSLNDGKPAWRIKTNAQHSGGVGSDGSLVAVGTDKGEVIALDASTGSARWRARVSSEILSAPVVSEGLVVVRSADSRIFAFDVADGKRRWVYQRAAASLIVRAPTGVTVTRGALFAGFSGGKLVAIDLRSGAARWEATVALPKGATELERVTDVSGEPVVDGREVCTAAFQGRAACYEVSSGNQLWARELSTLTGMSTDGRYAFVADDKGAIHALDRTNGRSLWKQDQLANRLISQVLPLGNELVAGDYAGVIHLISRDTGTLLGRANTDGGHVRAAPLRIPNGFVVQTANGGVFAFAL